MGYLLHDAIEVIEMPSEMSINIDTSLDFELANLVLENFSKENEMEFWILRNEDK